MVSRVYREESLALGRWLGGGATGQNTLVAGQGWWPTGDTSRPGIEETLRTGISRHFQEGEQRVVVPGRHANGIQIQGAPYPQAWP